MEILCVYCEAGTKLLILTLIEGRLVADPSPRRPGFDPRSVRVGFVVDRVALGPVFLRVRRFDPVSIIPPTLHY